MKTFREMVIDFIEKLDDHSLMMLYAFIKHFKDRD